MTETFTKTMHMPLLWGRRALQGRLDYTSDDPHAVMFTITDHLRGDEKEWAIARDLFRDGCNQSVGEGDVRIWPGPSTTRMRIRISSPNGGDATLELSRMLIQAFVSRIYAAVPAGREPEWTRSVDDELTALLESSGEGERA